MDKLYFYMNLNHYAFKVILCLGLFIHTIFAYEDDKDNVMAVRTRGGYFSLDEAMVEFNDPKFLSDDSVQGLLKVYRTNCPMYFGKYPEKQVTSRHIFIAVEGTHRVTRNIISHKLARELKAKHVYSPPTFMTRTRLVHNETVDMKRAFFMLGIYGTAHNVRDIISETPVVTAGYYVDQIAFSIAGAFQHELPVKTSAVYKWPSDLLKPDILFFINIPSQMTKKTIDPESFRGRIVQIYRNWAYPPHVIEVNNTHLYSGMVDHMIQTIKKKLGYAGAPTDVSSTDDINQCFQRKTDPE